VFSTTSFVINTGGIANPTLSASSSNRSQTCGFRESVTIFERFLLLRIVKSLESPCLDSGDFMANRTAMLVWEFLRTRGGYELALGDGVITTSRTGIVHHQRSWLRGAPAVFSGSYRLRNHCGKLARERGVLGVFEFA
jgi:hypothetical protein